MKRSRSSAWRVVTLVAATLATAGALDAQGPFSPAVRLETGRLLVARPGMIDPNFSQTVVFLLSYGEDGAVGVIVNRPTEVALSTVLPQVGLLADRPEVVFRGGPVGVHRLIFAIRAATPPAGCEPVLADVCAGGSLELLEEALGGDGATAVMGFAGHAGWAPGQLEWEIEQYGWYVLPGDSKRVFDADPDELWSDLVRVAESPVA